MSVSRKAALGCLLAATSLGCATARNYEDPKAPVYTGGAAAHRDGAATLRVVTFNLKWGKEIDRAAELLSRPGPLQGADLVVLEEVDREGTERIGRALGLAYVYVPSAVHPVPGHDFGVALLSPWPLDAPRKLLLPHENLMRKLRRSAAVATMRSPLGPIRVYGIHFESMAGAFGSVRRDQARAVLADSESWTGPVVVAGDFNGRGAPKEMAKLGFFWATETVKNTAGPFEFDHVMALGLCPAPGTESSGVASDSNHASDHKPVWAVFARCGAMMASAGADK